MQQDLDLNEKKEKLGAVVTVISHGSAWRLGDSCSALPRQFRSSKALARAIQTPDLAAEAVALVSRRSYDAALMMLSCSQLMRLERRLPRSPKQSKIYPWVTTPRLSALHVEGISSLSRSYAACTPTTKESEQRCCAAA
jgi:hypothetical protein